jgi:hypothetical protein
MDIDAEIKVMQTMLSGDNLIKTDMNSIRDTVSRPAPAGENASTAQAETAAAPAPAEEEKTTKEGIKLTLGGQ